MPNIRSRASATDRSSHFTLLVELLKSGFKLTGMGTPTYSPLPIRQDSILNHVSLTHAGEKFCLAKSNLKWRDCFWASNVIAFASTVDIGVNVATTLTASLRAEAPRAISALPAELPLVSCLRV